MFVAAARLQTTFLAYLEPRKVSGGCKRPSSLKLTVRAPQILLDGFEGHFEAGEREGKGRTGGKRKKSRGAGENTPWINFWLCPWMRGRVWLQVYTMLERRQAR